MGKIKKFINLKFEEEENDSYKGFFHAEICFENGYSMSIVCGRDKRLFRVQVGKGGYVCYDTPITNGVIGWQTEKQVTELMKKIQELKYVSYEENNV